jgi:hypothetical protein
MAVAQAAKRAKISPSVRQARTFLNGRLAKRAAAVAAQAVVGVDPAHGRPGPFPSPAAETGTSTFLGQSANYAGSVNSSGSTIPGGWMPADGRLLPISQFSGLFAVVGTT